MYEEEVFNIICSRVLFGFFIINFIKNLNYIIFNKNNTENNKLLQTSYKNNSNKYIKPLQCSYKYLFNYDIISDDIYYDINNTNDDLDNDIINDSENDKDDDLDNDSENNEDDDLDNDIINDSNEDDDLDNDSENDEDDDLDNDSENDEDDDLDNDIINDSNEDDDLENDIINDSNEDDEDDAQKNYNIYITTNYNDEFKKTNNPFFKNLNIIYNIIFEKNKLINKNFIEINNYFDILDLNDDNNNDDNLNNIILTPNCSIEEYNNNYIKLTIKNNNTHDFTKYFINIINKFYNFDDNFVQINIIFNAINLNIFERFYEYFQNNKYITYKLFDINDIYAYINNDKELLNYNDVNFSNDVDKLKKYFNTEKKNLDNNNKNLDKIIKIII